MANQNKKRVVFKMVDTCAAEFDASTPYYYSTCHGDENESCASEREKIIILGSGPIRIGQGIEFDYCTVHCALALREMGYETIIVNNNPETVSTDFDISDKLYFEPLTFENIMSIVENEKKNLLGVIVQFGGQTAINLSVPLEKEGVRILGTPSYAIDLAEDRGKFGKVLEKIGLDAAEWGTGYSFEEVKAISVKIGFPVLIRPSYVLGGRAMEIVHDERELAEYIEEAVRVSEGHPVLVDKFLQDATEIDVDAICDGKNVFIGAVMEHIEEAGIHSGDSACVIPPQTMGEHMIERIQKATRDLALALNTIGHINIQFAIKDDKIYVLEANPRASRTVPFVSKAIGIPFAKIGTGVLTGKKLTDLLGDMLASNKLAMEGDLIKMRKIDYVAVKEVVFPFTKLPGVDPILGPEMKSTGEVMGIDKGLGVAYYKAQLAAGNALPLSGNIFISVKDPDKTKIAPLAKEFKEIGFDIISTSSTSVYLTEHGIENKKIVKIKQGSPNILDMMKEKKIDLIINTPRIGRDTKRDGYMMRRAAIELNVPYITTIAGAKATVCAIKAMKSPGFRMEIRSINEYHHI